MTREHAIHKPALPQSHRQLGSRSPRASVSVDTLRPKELKAGSPEMSQLCTYTSVQQFCERVSKSWHRHAARKFSDQHSNVDEGSTPCKPTTNTHHEMRFCF